jgi:hypothetical protein
MLSSTSFVSVNAGRSRNLVFLHVHCIGEFLRYIAGIPIIKYFQIPSNKNIWNICEQQLRVYVIKSFEGVRVFEVQRARWKSTLRACTDFSSR